MKTNIAALPHSLPIGMGPSGTRVDWSEVRKRWQVALPGVPVPDFRTWGLPIKLDDEQLRAMGFLYASGDKNPPRVDLNQ